MGAATRLQPSGIVGSGMSLADWSASRAHNYTFYWSLGRDRHVAIRDGAAHGTCEDWLRHSAIQRLSNQVAGLFAGPDEGVAAIRGR